MNAALVLSLYSPENPLCAISSILKIGLRLGLVLKLLLTLWREVTEAMTPEKQTRKINERKDVVKDPVLKFYSNTQQLNAGTMSARGAFPPGSWE